MIAVCVLVVPAVALLKAATTTMTYVATSSLLFRDPGFDQKLFGSSIFSPSNDPNREAATNVRLVSLKVVARRTAEALGGKPSAQQVAEAVRVDSQGQSNVVEIAASASSPALAAKLANTFGEEYIAFRREADRSKIREARTLVARQLTRLPSGDPAAPRRRSLERQQELLQTLEALQTGNAELVQQAELPVSPDSPKPVRYGILGLVVGLGLGLGLAWLLERLDRRLKETSDVEAAFERPVIGMVPLSPSAFEVTILRAGLPDPTEFEPFRMLSANLRYFNVDRRLRSVLVTSAAPADGKTTVACNLALAAAATGRRVLLLEADMRNPTIHTRWQLDRGRGLSSVLSTGSAWREVIQEVPAGAANGSTPHVLDVLLAGPVPPNPTDLTESERMRELLDETLAEYELVVIDTPPTSVVSDAVPLVTRVDGVVVVTRLRQTTKDAAARLRDQLENLGAPILGVVINGVTVGDAGYGYGSAYPYGEVPARTAEASGIA